MRALESFPERFDAGITKFNVHFKEKDHWERNSAAYEYLVM